MPFCPTCGTQLSEGASSPNFAAAGPAAGAAAGTGLPDNLAGALAYFTFVPAIIFLVLEPYNKNRFIRFHAFQCLFLSAALFAIGIVLAMIASIPFIGLITIPLHFLVWIGAIVVAILLMLKAYQNEMYKLPVIGDMAERQAGAM
jgi:uncharacterized membrane protein